MLVVPCENCGAPLQMGAAACLHCESAPRKGVRPSSSRNRARRIRRVLLVVGVVAVVAIVAVTSWLATGGTRPAQRLNPLGVTAGNTAPPRINRISTPPPGGFRPAR